jgi:hypothetical protein
LRVVELEVQSGRWVQNRVVRERMLGRGGKGKGEALEEGRALGWCHALGYTASVGEAIAGISGMF